MFENITEWIKKITKPTTNKKTPETEGMIMPFLDSALNSPKKEAMAGLLYEAMRNNNKQAGEKILASELMETIQELEKNGRLPTEFKLFPKLCWRAFCEMAMEGLLIIHQEDEREEGFVVVTEELNKLLFPVLVTDRKKLSVI